MTTTSGTLIRRMVRESTSKLLKLKVATGVIRYALLILLVIPNLVPFVFLVLGSFKTNLEVLSDTLALPKAPSLVAYSEVIMQEMLPLYFVNTVIVSGSSVILLLLISTLAAYPMARFSFRGNSYLNLLFSVGIFIPGISLVVPELKIMGLVGLYDTKLGLIVMYVALFFPVTFQLLRSFFLTLPKELEEAAIIDGADYFTILGKVIAPLAKPGLATAAVINFIWTWNEFFYAFVLTGSVATRTMQIAIRFFMARFNFNMPGLFAAVTIAMLPPVVAFLLLQEQVISGLTAGAVRG